MLSSEITELRRLLHRCPELSCREEQTQAILMQFLKTRSALEIVPRGKWFYAHYRSSAAQKRPPIAFRADMDALPMDETLRLPYASENTGIAHKCGHDGHSAALAGFGCTLEALAPDRDVYLIFQYGEEIGAGGAECSTLLDEKQIAEVYACHNWSGFPQGQILAKAGTAQCASQGLTVRFQVSAAHASQPENGRNPSAALALLALFIEARAGHGIRKADEPLLLATIVGLKAGGRNFGMAASAGELSVTLRAEQQEDMDSLKADIFAKATALADEHALTVSFSDADVFPATVCSEACVRKVLRCAESLGFSAHTLEKPFRASEDFGYYLQKRPGAIFYVGNGVGYPEIHTSAYDFPDSDLPVIIRMFSALCTAK